MESNEKSAPTPVQTSSDPQVPAASFTSDQTPVLTPYKFITLEELNALKTFVSKFDDEDFKKKVADNDHLLYFNADEKTIELLRTIFIYDRQVRRVRDGDVNRAENYSVNSLHELFRFAAYKGSTEMNRLIDQYETAQNAYLKRKIGDLTIQELAYALPFISAIPLPV